MPAFAILAPTRRQPEGVVCSNDLFSPPAAGQVIGVSRSIPHSRRDLAAGTLNLAAAETPSAIVLCYLNSYVLLYASKNSFLDIPACVQMVLKVDDLILE